MKEFSPAIRNPIYRLAIAKQHQHPDLCTSTAQKQKTPQLKVVGFPIRVLNYNAILHYTTFQVDLIERD